MTFIREIHRNNKVYLYLVKSERDGQKIKQINLKYLGEKEQFYKKLKEGTYSLDEIDFVSSISYGNIVFFYNIIHKLKIIEIINLCVQKNSDITPSVGGLVAILILNRVIAPSSKIEVPKWYTRTVLDKILHISAEQVQVQSLCRAMDYLTDDCIKQIEIDLLKHLNTLYKLDLNTLFYDITSSYFEGKKCTLAFFGYSRDHRKDRRQIVIGLVISRHTRFPIMHRVFPGNTVDWKTIELVINQLKTEQNIAQCTIVTDRGMMQKQLRAKLTKQNLQFITGVKSSEKIAKHLIETITETELIPFQARSGAKFKYYANNFEDEGIVYQIILVFSPKMRDIQEQAFMEKITKIKKNLDELQEDLKDRHKNSELLEKRLQNILKTYKKYFQITITSDEKGFQKLSYELQEIECEKMRIKFGKYVLISNVPRITPEVIIQSYLDKWEVEDAFKFLKTSLDLRPINHWKNSRIKSHVFVCILAYLIRTVIEYELDQLHMPFSYSQLKMILAESKLIQFRAKNKVGEKITEFSPEAKIIFDKFKTEFI